MASSPDEVTRLNDQATKLFEEGKFQDAGKLYERANKVDTMNSPIYLANLSLVELRLEQYQKAEVYATQALLRDPRYLKARFRRAYARWGQARRMEALVDFAGALTVDPTDKATMAASPPFTLSTEVEASKEFPGYLSPMLILQADYPSAYGSPSAPRPRNVQTVSRADGAIMIPDHAVRVPKDRKGGTCASCKNFAWDQKRAKACSGCTTTFYCDEVCQRKHWPEHKTECIPYDKTFALTMHLCKTLLHHHFIRMHLMVYAVRSMGALYHSPPPYFTFLLVLVELVPLGPGPKARRRIAIRHIVNVPLAVIDKQTRNSYFTQRERMRQTTGDPDAVGIESHSLGVGRKVTPDLDALYWSLEDELANDVENYYGLQR
ncbi:hypothetical protein B0H13DRAFT_1890390 [Mycena leptocephala]|nr:hypothetical protein B0H13DRAFT_1890390 [Mycena leptocephala]